MDETGQPGAATPGEHDDGTGQRDDLAHSASAWAPSGAGWARAADGGSRAEPALSGWRSSDPGHGWASSSVHHGDLPAPLPGTTGSPVDVPSRVNGRQRTNGHPHTDESGVGRQAPVSAPPGLAGDARDSDHGRLAVPAQRPAPAVEQVVDPGRETGGGALRYPTGGQPLVPTDPGPLRHPTGAQPLVEPGAAVRQPTGAHPVVEPGGGATRYPTGAHPVLPAEGGPARHASDEPPVARPPRWSEGSRPASAPPPSTTGAAFPPPVGRRGPDVDDPPLAPVLPGPPSWGEPAGSVPAEQVRAEQVRAEQSRAEQARAGAEDRRATETERPGRAASDADRPGWAASEPERPGRAASEPERPGRAASEPERPGRAAPDADRPGWTGGEQSWAGGEPERPAWAGGGWTSPRFGADRESRPPEGVEIRSHEGAEARSHESVEARFREGGGRRSRADRFREDEEPVGRRSREGRSREDGSSGWAPRADPREAEPRRFSDAGPTSPPDTRATHGVPTRRSYEPGPEPRRSYPVDQSPWASDRPSAAPSSAPPVPSPVDPPSDPAALRVDPRTVRPFRLRPEAAEADYPPPAEVPPGHHPDRTGAGPVAAPATSGAERADLPPSAPAPVGAPSYTARRSAPDPVSPAPPTAADRRPDGTPAVLPQRVPAEPDVPVVPEPPAVEPPAQTPELARIATHLRREDEPAPPQERPEGFDVNAILDAVRGVAGVRDASLRRTTAGAHSLRLDLADGADAAEVSRHVARLLQERMGLAAAPQNVPGVSPTPAPPVRRRIAPPPEGRAEVPPEVRRRRRQPGPVPRGRATVEEQPPAPSTPWAPFGVPATGSPVTLGTSYSGGQRTTTETAPSRPLDTGGVTGPRVVIDHVQVSTFGLDADVEVRLLAGERNASGRAVGPAVDGYVLRLCAVAAAAAVDELLRVAGAGRGRCFVEHAAVVPFGTCEVATVVVLLVCDGWVEQLAGSALVSGADPRQAVVRATLAAVNRRLEALLT